MRTDGEWTQEQWNLWWEERWKTARNLAAGRWDNIPWLPVRAYIRHLTVARKGMSVVPCMEVKTAIA